MVLVLELGLMPMLIPIPAVIRAIKKMKVLRATRHLRIHKLL